MTGDYVTIDRDRYVIGVDPGGSTGIAIVRDVALFKVIQRDPESALDWLEDQLRYLVLTGCDVVLACERYVELPNRGRKTAQSGTQRAIGAVERLASGLDVPFDLQSPADAKALAPNRLLHRLNMWVSGKMVDRTDANDANDAVRHALLLMARRRAATFDRLLASRP